MAHKTYRTRRQVHSLSRQTCHGLIALVAVTAFSATFVAHATSADPASAEEPENTARKGEKRGKKGHKKLRAVKRWYQANMKLAQHYMLASKYNEALDHFTAVINYTPQLPTAATPDKRKNARKAEGRRGRRGLEGRLHKVKVHAYMGASIAAWRLGDKKAFGELSQAGLQYADANNIPKASEMFERLIADPATVADDIAPSVKKLEQQIETVEGELP